MTKLLTLSESSPKLAKYTGDEYMAAILYLASAAYDPRLCPNAGACVKSCLIVNAGRGAIGGPDNPVARARKRRSDLLLSDRLAFKLKLCAEIAGLEEKAIKQGKKLAIRLNGGSDLDWTDIYREFPNVQFWEYTKRPDLALDLHKLPNVHVTYSYNERSSTRIMVRLLQTDINIAKVFDVRKGKPLPEGVIDGDLHDFRFLDPKGVIVGLRLKSLRKPTAEQKAGGFVQEVQRG